MKQSLIAACLSLFLLAACQNEEIANESIYPPTVSLRFQWRPTGGSRTATNEEVLKQEESRVYTLTYALFQNQVLKKTETVRQPDNGLLPSPVVIASIPKDWIDSTTQLFAVANWPEDQELPTDYAAWCNLERTDDLNTAATQAPSRTIDRPVMAGFLALTKNSSASLVVSMERIYSRIWMQFDASEFQETDVLHIDYIRIEGLLRNTRVFNLSDEVTANNPSLAKRFTYEIKNSPAVQVIPAPPMMQTAPALPTGTSPWESPQAFTATQRQPFLGKLSGEPPYFWGPSPQLTLPQNQANTYRTICAFRRDETTGEELTQQMPVRYYVYSYQWGSNELEGNPLITIQYHFTKKGGQEETDGIIHKVTRAHLYDPLHANGKHHHGLRRNFTYQLNCRVNTHTQHLHVQVVSVPWYKVDIDDIPSFE